MLTIEDIKKVVAEIAPKYNLKKVTLFGSRATENFRTRNLSKTSNSIFPNFANSE